MVNDDYLDVSWHIVIVATSDDTAALRATLQEVEAKSYGGSITILRPANASQNASQLEGADPISYPVKYCLPPVIEPGCYWSTILPLYPLGREKTLFVQVGTKLPHHWDARLVAAGCRAKTTAAVSPLCARHPILSAFSDPDHKPGLSCDEVDQWLNDYVKGMEFSVPVLLESCALLQGELWQAIGSFDNDVKMLESLRLDGHNLVAADQVYIDDSSLDYPTELGFLAQGIRNAFGGRHPLTSTRHALLELSSRGEKPPQLRSCLPVQLHVGHSWGGGLGRWIEDFLAADSRHNHLVLRSVGDMSGFGQSIALYHGAHMGIPLQTWVLSEPIMSTALSHFEYQCLIEEIIAEFSVESLMISSLIGHSLDLLRTQLATTCVFHDFFPYCPALYATFGKPCLTCTAGDMRDCAKSNPLHSFFKFESNEHWQSIRGAFIELLLDRPIVMVAPTPSVAERYCQLEPRLLEKTINIIEHGLDPALAQSLVPPETPQGDRRGERLRIVMLGRLSAEKGGDILQQIIEEVSTTADIWLLGVGESGAQFTGTDNVTIVPEYQKLELGRYLHQIDADIGLLLSVVPETFSYTLSELWAAGIPVLATRLGAFKDRIVDSRNGWLVDIEGSKIVAKIRQIDSDRAALAGIRDALRQETGRTAAGMVASYGQLEIPEARVPLTRYRLPRKTYQNPYKNQRREKRALYIDEQVTYNAVLTEFLSYTSRKLEQSSRLPRPVSGAVRKLFSLVTKLLSRGQAIKYPPGSKKRLL